MEKSVYLFVCAQFLNKLIPIWHHLLASIDELEVVGPSGYMNL